MPLESSVPEFDEVRLLKSGRIRVWLEADREVVLRRPTLGQLRRLMERYDEIRDEVFEDGVDPVLGRRKVREGRQAMEVGSRWWTEVLVVLGPEDNPAKYDNEDAPAWTMMSDAVFPAFFKHWTEVPLVSDVLDPEPPRPPPPRQLAASTQVPTIPFPEPVIRHQATGSATGP